MSLGYFGRNPYAMFSLVHVNASPAPSSRGGETQFDYSWKRLMWFPVSSHVHCRGKVGQRLIDRPSLSLSPPPLSPLLSLPPLLSLHYTVYPWHTRLRRQGAQGRASAPFPLRAARASVETLKTTWLPPCANVISTSVSTERERERETTVWTARTQPHVSSVILKPLKKCSPKKGK